MSGQRITSLPTSTTPSTVSPPPPNPARDVQAFVGSVMETAMSPINALNMGVAQATLAFVQALPKFPAARLFSDMVFGWPHAHGHPPNLIPPSPIPIPLPSIGPVICAGAVSVLINGLPAARCGDVGFGAWCGGIFPLFEVQTGSSHVFIGGARPARMLIDFTRHCMPGTPGLGKMGAAMMAFSAGMGALGVAASLTDKDAAEEAALNADSATEVAMATAAATAAGVGAGVAAAQTAADLAATALQAGMGKDPAVPPGVPMGNFISGSPNVIIGGFPMPGWMAILRGLGKLLRVSARGVQKLFPKNQKLQNALCAITGHPVDIASGRVFTSQVDFERPGRIPIEFTRRYDTSSVDYDGPFGPGWIHPFDIHLWQDKDQGMIIFRNEEARVVGFPLLTIGQKGFNPFEKLWLERTEEHVYVLTNDAGIQHRFSLVQPERRNAAEAGTSEATAFRLTTVEDATGNRLRFSYEDGNLKTITDSAGDQLRFDYLTLTDGRKRIAEIHLTQDELTTRTTLLMRYAYDESGHLVNATDRGNVPWHYAYDHDLLIRETNRNGSSFHFEYEGAGQNARCIHTWGDGGIFERYLTYDSAALSTLVKDPLGDATTYSFNELGLPIVVIDVLGGVTRNEYDDVGRKTTSIDPEGRRTEYRYDEHGNVLQLTRPDGRSIITQYNEANKAIRITDPNGNGWQQEWDAHNLLTRQVTPLGAESQYEYDVRGQLTRVINPLGAQTTLAYDSYGNLTRLTDALDHTTVFTYDAFGNVTTKLDALGQRTRYTYDEKGRLTQVTLPSGATITCAYDAEDNLIRYQDENGAVTQLEYSGSNEILRRLQPDGNVVEYHYDSEDRLIGVSNQRGERYELKRDTLGRIVEEVDYWGQGRRYAYTAAGDLTESVDPLGRLIRYQTDPLGRIFKKLLPDPTQSHGVQEETFAYDANGNLTACENAAIRVTRQFDPEGRLLEERQGEECVVSNTYDLNGNRITRTTSLELGGQSYAHTVHYRFDALDQAIAIEVEGHSPLRLTRNALGQVTEERLSPDLRRRLAYSVDGYLTAQEVTRDARPLFDQTYTYDAAGNLSEKRDSEYGVERFTYDPLGRLIAHLDPQQRLKRYLADPAGDRLRTRVMQRPNGSDTDHEWSREGEYDGTFYRFDRAGNLIHRSGTGPDTNFTWDANQRLIASRANDKTTTYQYDPLGRRVAKQTGDSLTYFYWDGDTLLGDVLVSKGERQSLTLRLMREWVYYPETFEPLAMIQDQIAPEQSESNNWRKTLYLYHNDPNGCPNRLMDPEGQVVWAVQYEAWGTADQLVVSRVDNPLRLQGQYCDAETGLHYNRYRYYDPVAGQFVSQDPIGLMGGDNLYLYALAPTSWIDPLGLICQKTIDRYKILRSKGLTPAEALAVAKGGRYTSRSRAHLSASHHHARSTPQLGKGRFNVGEGGQRFTDEVIYHPNTTFTRQGNGRLRFDNPGLGRGPVGRGTDNVTPVQGGRVVLESLSPPGYSSHAPTDVVTQFPQ